MNFTNLLAETYNGDGVILAGSENMLPKVLKLFAKFAIIGGVFLVAAAAILFRSIAL